MQKLTFVMFCFYSIFLLTAVILKHTHNHYERY